MSYIGDFALGKTFDSKFTTVSTTGAPTTLAGTPVISAYLDNSLTQLTAGITLSVDFDGVTGLHNVRVVATSGNGYATATNYQLVITTGTVGGTSVVGYVVAEFSIEARSAIRPATADRTLVVDAAGLADANMVKAGATGAGNAITTSGGVTLPAGTVASTTNLTAGTIATVTNQLTAAQVATGIWQDAVAGDFTVASSIGKSLFTGNVAPGGTNGLFIAGTNAATSITTALTANITGNVSGSAGSVTGAVGSVTGAVGSVGTGGITTTSFAAGAIDAAAIAASALGTSEVASAVDDRITSAIWNKARTSHTTQGTFGESQNAVISGAAIAGTLSTTQMTTDLTNATDSSMNGRTIVFIGNGTAALKGQATNITAYTGATKLLTFTAVTTAPIATDQFLIF